MISLQWYVCEGEVYKRPSDGMNLKPWGDRKGKVVGDKVSEVDKGKSLLALIDYSKEYKVI